MNTVQFGDPLVDAKPHTSSLSSGKQLKPAFKSPTSSGSHPSPAEANDPSTAVAQEIVVLK